MNRWPWTGRGDALAGISHGLSLLIFRAASTQWRLLSASLCVVILSACLPPLLTCLLYSETSIVDSTPGTTADTKVVLMELHDVGPAKLFDTGGWLYCSSSGGALCVLYVRSSALRICECEVMCHLCFLRCKPR